MLISHFPSFIQISFVLYGCWFSGYDLCVVGLCVCSSCYFTVASRARSWRIGKMMSLDTLVMWNTSKGELVLLHSKGLLNKNENCQGKITGNRVPKNSLSPCWRSRGNAVVRI